MAVLARKDAPKESTWNKEAVYPTWKDWQAEFETAQAEIPKLSEFEGKLGEGPEKLVAYSNNNKQSLSHDHCLSFK